MGISVYLAAGGVPGGGYLSILKAVPVLLVLLLWARLLTWVDKDAPAAHLPRLGLNAGFLGGLVLAYGLFFFVPFYFVALPLLIVVMGIEAGVYLGMRHSKVGLGDLKDQFRAWLKSFQKKKEEKVAAGLVQLFTKDGKLLPVPQSDDPDRVAYDATQQALTEPVKKEAEQIDLDARSDSGVPVKYIVDGFTYQGKVLDRAGGTAAIAYLKRTAGLDPEDRRKPQQGTMRFGVDGNRRELKVQTAGNTAGEYMRLVVDPKKRHEFKLDALGFNERQLPLIKESIQENKGLVIISAPRAQGLTSLTYGMLRGHDAFLEHIQTVEREPEQELEGITQNKLAGNATAAEEFKSADWVISQEPDVIMVNKVEDPRTAASLIKYAKSGKRVYVAMRANSTFDALDQWRKLVGDDNLAVDSLAMIINGRVLRKLCNACKLGYAPDPGLLRKLGMSEKVTQLFQARTTPMRDPKGNPIPCEFCHDLHFKGRIGVYEIMPVDDEMREAIIGGKNINQVFRKQRGRFLQEEALALVEKGETSVQEVSRVLKGGDGAAGATAGSEGGAPASPRAAAARPAGTPTRAARS